MTEKYKTAIMSLYIWILHIASHLLQTVLKAKAYAMNLNMWKQPGR